MNIRKAEMADFDEIEAVYAHARQFMREQGNPSQWNSSRPLVSATLQDLEQSVLYVVEENGLIEGVFAILTGEDPTYGKIGQGSWLNDSPYCVIHRIASRKPGLHLFDTALHLASSAADNLRMDTHRNNRPMLHLLESRGFVRCGIIWTDDGTERIAFHKIFSSSDSSSPIREWSE